MVQFFIGAGIILGYVGFMAGLGWVIQKIFKYEDYQEALLTAWIVFCGVACFVLVSWALGGLVQIGGRG